MSPAVIFGAVNISTSIASYFGLIESVGGDVSKLVHAPFKSAVNNLKAASTTSGQTAEMYIKQALFEFNQECALESNENLISAHIGKAMCQHLLNDHINRDLTMASIRDIELTLSEKTKSVSKDVLKTVGFGMWYQMYKLYKGGTQGESYFNSYEERVEKFNKYKNLALSTR